MSNNSQKRNIDNKILLNLTDNHANKLIKNKNKTNVTE